MIIIKESNINSSKLFNLNGLEYAKGIYIIKYDSVTSHSTDNARIAIVSKFNLNDYLVPYSSVSSYNDGTNNYINKIDLINDLSDLLGFNLGGASSIPTEGLAYGGFVDYNDSSTSTDPISFTDTKNVVLTNDTLGAFTNTSYLPTGVTSIFSNNRFDFTQLSLGDMVDIRLDVTVITSSPNQEIKIDLALGINASEYTIPFEDTIEKSTGSHSINVYNGIYMGDNNTLNNPAEFRLSSDGNGTVVVNGWYCKIIKRG